MRAARGNVNPAEHRFPRHGENFITKSSGVMADQTPTKIADLFAKPVTGKLTESEITRFMAIRRDVNRGYAVTIKDMGFLVDMVERLRH